MFKHKILAAAGTLTAVAGLAVAGAPAASASVAAARPQATTACGSICNDFFNRALGDTSILTTSGKAWGSTLTLKPGSDSNLKQDFIVTEVGTLGQFVSAKVISARSYVALNYPSSYEVVEQEFAPGSATTGQCGGLQSGHVRPGTTITLRLCGASARVLWVVDSHHAVPDSTSVVDSSDAPLVNAADKRISHPLVLTSDASGNLTVQREKMNLGKVIDTQQFGVRPGPASPPS